MKCFLESCIELKALHEKLCSIVFENEEFTKEQLSSFPNIRNKCSVVNCKIVFDNTEHLKKMLMDSVSEKATPSDLPVLSLDINEWPLLSSEKKQRVKSGHSKDEASSSYGKNDAKANQSSCEAKEKPSSSNQKK